MVTITKILKHNFTRANTSVRSFGSRIANSNLREPTIAISPIILTKSSKAPKSEGVKIREMKGAMINGMIRARPFPENITATFLTKGLLEYLLNQAIKSIKIDLFQGIPIPLNGFGNSFFHCVGGLVAQ